MFIARPGNNNRLLFITPTSNARILQLSVPRFAIRLFTIFNEIYGDASVLEMKKRKRVQTVNYGHTWNNVVILI